MWTQDLTDFLVGPDLVLGTLRGASCGAALCEIALSALRTESLRVTRDDPYAGGEVVRCFGRPDRGIHALQLEVSRNLYMDEHRLQLSAM